MNDSDDNDDNDDDNDNNNNKNNNNIKINMSHPLLVHVNVTFGATICY